MEHGSERRPPDEGPQRPSPEEIYAETVDLVWGILRKAGLDQSADGKDIVQETFITAFRILEAYDPSRPLRPWIATIAWNAIRSYRRKGYRRREQLAMAKDFDDFDDRTPSAEEQIAAEERTDIIARALADIPDEARMVIILHEFENFTMEEVAEIMSISLATAYRRLKSAKISFEKALRRLSKSERETLGLSSIAFAPLTEAQLNEVLHHLQSLPRSRVPDDIRNDVWARLREDFPELPESPDGPPISGPRPTPPPAPTRPHPPANAPQPTLPSTNAPTQLFAQLATKKGVAVLLSAFLTGAGSKTALDHLLTPSPPTPLETAPTATPQPPTPWNSASLALTAPPIPPPTSAIEPSAHATATAPRVQIKPTTAAKDLTEPALMDSARDRLNSGSPAEALALAEKHRRDFAQGKHAQERDWIMIMALAQLGQRSRAAAELARFRQSYPRSALLPALAQAVEGAPATR